MNALHSHTLLYDYSSTGNEEEFIHYVSVFKEKFTGLNRLGDLFPMLYAAQKRYDKGLQYIIENENADHEMLSYFYAMTGDTAKAEEHINRNDFSHVRLKVYCYIAMNQFDKALDLLEQSYRERFPWIMYINSEFYFDPLREEPRFKALVKKLGFPEK